MEAIVAVITKAVTMEAVTMVVVIMVVVVTMANLINKKAFITTRSLDVFSFGYKYFI